MVMHCCIQATHLSPQETGNSMYQSTACSVPGLEKYCQLLNILWRLYTWLHWYTPAGSVLPASFFGYLHYTEETASVMLNIHWCHLQSRQDLTNAAPCRCPGSWLSLQLLASALCKDFGRQWMPACAGKRLYLLIELLRKLAHTFTNLRAVHL